MNANELKVLEDSLKVIEQLQAEKEALEKRVDEVKDTNGTFVDLVQLQREEIDKLRQQQAEIEALKAENKFFKDLMGDVEILRKAQEK